MPKIIQKGGTVEFHRRERLGKQWSGKNPTGDADADLFNYLGLPHQDYHSIWEFPNSLGLGLMQSPAWNNANTRYIIRLLNNIQDVRARELRTHADKPGGRRVGSRVDSRVITEDEDARDEGHTRVLARVRILLREIASHGIERLKAFWPNRLSIDKSDWANGIYSEVGNLFNTHRNKQPPPVPMFGTYEPEEGEILEPLSDLAAGAAGGFGASMDTAGALWRWGPLVKAADRAGGRHLKPEEMEDIYNINVREDLLPHGGYKKSKKSKKSRKQRKSRKFKKSRKQRKSRKSKKSRKQKKSRKSKK